MVGHYIYIDRQESIGLLNLHDRFLSASDRVYRRHIIYINIKEFQSARDNTHRARCRLYIILLQPCVYLPLTIIIWCQIYIYLQLPLKLEISISSRDKSIIFLNCFFFDVFSDAICLLLREWKTSKINYIFIHFPCIIYLFILSLFKKKSQ